MVMDTMVIGSEAKQWCLMWGKAGPRDPQVIFLPNLVEAYVNHVKNTRSRRQDLFSPIIGQNMGSVHGPMLHSSPGIWVKKVFAHVSQIIWAQLFNQLFPAQVCKYLGQKSVCPCESNHMGQLIHQQLSLPM